MSSISGANPVDYYRNIVSIGWPPNPTAPNIGVGSNIDIGNSLNGSNKELYRDIIDSKLNENGSVTVKFPNEPARMFSNMEDALKYCDKNYLSSLESRQNSLKTLIEQMQEKQSLLNYAKQSGKLSPEKLKQADEVLETIKTKLNSLQSEYNSLLEHKKTRLNVQSLSSNSSGIFPGADGKTYGEALRKNPMNSSVFPSSSAREYGKMLADNPVQSQHVTAEAAKNVSKTKWKFPKLFNSRGGKILTATTAVIAGLAGYSMYTESEKSRLENLIISKGNNPRRSNAA